MPTPIELFKAALLRVGDRNAISALRERAQSLRECLDAEDDLSLSEEEMLNPKINILLGAEHLRGMLAGLRHPLFAVAAYNAGFNRVKDWEDRFGKIKAIDAFVENIPLPETRNYVKRVATSWVNYSSLYPNKDPLFGLDWAEKSASEKVR